MLKPQQNLILSSSLVGLSLFAGLDNQAWANATLPKSDDRVVSALQSNLESWQPLTKKLIADGFSKQQIERLFSSTALGPWSGVKFSLPKPEPDSIYVRFTDQAHVSLGVKFAAEHDSILQANFKATKVPASIIAAQMVIESGCGENTGSILVLKTLASRSLANQPGNIEENFNRLANDNPKLTRHEVSKRAARIASGSYKQLAALLRLDNAQVIAADSLRGSWAGAFGMPQFMPGTFEIAAKDGDRDSRINLFDVTDAIISTGNLHKLNGWTANMSESRTRAIIMRYNQSVAYANAVMDLAKLIELEL